MNQRTSNNWSPGPEDENSAVKNRQSSKRRKTWDEMSGRYSNFSN